MHAKGLNIRRCLGIAAVALVTACGGESEDAAGGADTGGQAVALSVQNEPTLSATAVQEFISTQGIASRGVGTSPGQISIASRSVQRAMASLRQPGRVTALAEPPFVDACSGGGSATQDNVTAKLTGDLSMTLDASTAGQTTATFTSTTQSFEQSANGQVQTSSTLRNFQLAHVVAESGQLTDTFSFNSDGTQAALGTVAYKAETPTALATLAGATEPSSGQIKVTVNGKGLILMTVEATRVRVQGDLEGDGTFEIDQARHVEQPLSRRRAAPRRLSTRLAGGIGTLVPGAHSQRRVVTGSARMAWAT